MGPSPEETRSNRLVRERINDLFEPIDLLCPVRNTEHDHQAERQYLLRIVHAPELDRLIEHAESGCGLERPWFIGMHQREGDSCRKPGRVVLFPFRRGLHVRGRHSTALHQQGTDQPNGLNRSGGTWEMLEE